MTEAEAIAEGVKQAKKVIADFKDLTERSKKAVEVQIDVARGIGQRWVNSQGETLERMMKPLREAAADYGSLLEICQVHGWPPPSKLGLKQPGEIVAEYYAAPDEARETVLSRRLVEIYADDKVLDGLYESWTAAEWMGVRRGVIVSALNAHRAGKHDLATLALVPQVEGMIGTAFNHPGRMNGSDLAGYVACMLEYGKGSTIEQVSHDAATTVFLTGFEWGDPIPKFSRHAILHGADTDFTPEKSVRAILLVEAVRNSLERNVVGKS